MRRVIAFISVLFGVVAFAAAPASAHTVSGVGATNYRSSITKLDPPIAGVTVRIIEAGSRIQLTNKTKEVVTVYGYEKEPYLQISTAGVFENINSPAVYLNVSRNGTTAPSTANPAAAPSWKKISNTNVARWHDHRIHWMGPNPPIVKNQPDKFHQINADWKINIQVGDQPATINGAIAWQPGPSLTPLLIMIGFVAVVAVAISRVPKMLYPSAAFVTTMFLGFDIAHRWGLLRGIAEPFITILDRDSEVIILSQIAWLGLLFAIYLAVRKKSDALVACLIAGMPLLIVSELTDWSVLHSSQVPSIYGQSSARQILALAIAFGVSTLGIALFELIRLRLRTPAAVAAPAAVPESV